MAANRGQPDITEDPGPVKVRILRRSIRHETIDCEARKALQKDTEEAKQAARDHLPVSKIRRTGHHAGGNTAAFRALTVPKQKVPHPCQDRGKQPDAQQLFDPRAVQIVIDS